MVSHFWKTGNAVDWLTAEDWSDLGSGALAMAGAAVTIALVLWLIRWCFPGARRLSVGFGDFAFLFVLAAIFTLSDIFERHGISNWWLWILLLPPIFIPPWLDRRRQARRRSETGAGDPSPCEIDSVPLSSEEKRVSLRITFLSLSAAALAVVAVLLVAFGPGPDGIAGTGLLLGLCVASLGVIAYIARGRWPGPLTLESTIEIDAPAETIWNTLRYVDGDPSYKRIIRRVEQLAQYPRETFLLHYFSDEHCPECGLPRDPETPGMFNRVEVIEAREGEFYRIHSCETDVRGNPQPGMIDMEDESHAIIPLPGRGCRVVNRSTVSRPKVWLALLLKIGDPLGEHLRHLKAHVEGREGETLWDTGAARIEAKRSAAQYCLCPNAAMPSSLAT